jgi:hypothetical protein
VLLPSGSPNLDAPVFIPVWSEKTKWQVHRVWMTSWKQHNISLLICFRFFVRTAIIGFFTNNWTLFFSGDADWSAGDNLLPDAAVLRVRQQSLGLRDVSGAHPPLLPAPCDVASAHQSDLSYLACRIGYWVPIWLRCGFRPSYSIDHIFSAGKMGVLVAECLGLGLSIYLWEGRVSRVDQGD